MMKVPELIYLFFFSFFFYKSQSKLRYEMLYDISNDLLHFRIKFVRFFSLYIIRQEAVSNTGCHLLSSRALRSPSRIILVTRFVLCSVGFVRPP